MRKESAMRKRVFPVIFMLIVTLVFISITTVIYTYTKDQITLNERLRLKEAVLYSAGVTIPAIPAEVDRLYEERVVEVKDQAGRIKYFEVKNQDSSAVESYVVIRTGAGPPRW